MNIPTPKTIANNYFNPALPLSVQSFNLLAFAGTAAGLAISVSSVLTDAGAANVILNLAASVLGLSLAVVANRTKRYRLCYWIVVSVVFMLFFPVLFFTAGGYRSGMPCFFVFAVIFTALMLEKRERAAALVAEMVIYAGCVLTAYYAPETVTPFATEFDYVLDVIIGASVSSVLLLLVVRVHIRIYDDRRAKLDELNRELAARNETLQKYDRMKSDFLAAVAHEVSQPLAVISASSADTVALLGESPAPPANMGEIMANHERIEKRVKLLDKVITDLMDTAAIETGRLSLTRQPVNLAELLKTACDTQFQQSDQNNNALAYDFQPGLPIIWADPARIEQVMANLVSNAARHTKDGVITVRLMREGKTQTVCVEDNGEGMDAEVAAVVMKQYAPSVKGDFWRHGIGLFLCRQIITSHGGEIWIESEKGRGTKIAFTLR